MRHLEWQKEKKKKVIHAGKTTGQVSLPRPMTVHRSFAILFFFFLIISHQWTKTEKPWQPIKSVDFTAPSMVVFFDEGPYEDPWNQRFSFHSLHILKKCVGLWKALREIELLELAAKLTTIHPKLLLMDKRNPKLHWNTFHSVLQF